MVELYGCKTKNIKVALGPCIQKCCYEVSNDLKTYFNREIESRDGKYYLDLALANKNQLLSAGVKEVNIYDSEICTFCNNSYFSYRREGDAAGRMLSLLMIKDIKKQGEKNVCQCICNCGK